jgi:beta-lactamase class A
LTPDGTGRRGHRVIICEVLKGGVVAVLAGLLCVVAGLYAGFASARSNRAGGVPGVEAAVPPLPGPLQGGGDHPSFDRLQSSVAQLLKAAGASGGVTVTELGGPSPQTWSLQGDQQFTAASTYKLPLLMEEAQNVAAGRWHGTDTLCYQDTDWEDGWYTDYQDGTCLSRAQLEHRVGHDSDNTAAHILIRYDGGGDALNQYAKTHGAQSSAFFAPNNTTSNDLARLWVDEAGGRAGGRPAQQYLYPMLTRTSFEDGIPAGLPKGTTVVHKIGYLGGTVNDAALVPQGPKGAYVLAICTQGQGGDPGWKLLADISRAVWQYETSR